MRSQPALTLRIESRLLMIFFRSLNSLIILTMRSILIILQSRPTFVNLAISPRFPDCCKMISKGMIEIRSSQNQNFTYLFAINFLSLTRLFICKFSSIQPVKNVTMISIKNDASMVRLMTIHSIQSSMTKASCHGISKQADIIITIMQISQRSFHLLLGATMQLETNVPSLFC